MPINSDQEKGRSLGGQTPAKDLDKLINYPFLGGPENGLFENLPETDFVKRLFKKIQEKFPERKIIVEELGSSGWNIRVDNVVIYVGMTALNTAIDAPNLNLRPTIKKSDYNQHPWFKEILDSMASEVVFID